MKADAVLDGELVALDQHGISRFQLLQNALRAQATLRYYLFDLTLLDGHDLRRLPLLARKEKLRGMLPKHPLLAYSAHRPEYGIKYFKEAEKRGLEGIMAKRAASPYLSGQRSRDWLKIKTARRQEVVIAGFTAPRRLRPCFGALVLAVREGKAWRYVGHVGTGFSHSVWDGGPESERSEQHLGPGVENTDKTSLQGLVTWHRRITAHAITRKAQWSRWARALGRLAAAPSASPKTSLMRSGSGRSRRWQSPPALRSQSARFGSWDSNGRTARLSP